MMRYGQWLIWIVVFFLFAGDDLFMVREKTGEVSIKPPTKQEKTKTYRDYGTGIGPWHVPDREPFCTKEAIERYLDTDHFVLNCAINSCFFVNIGSTED